MISSTTGRVPGDRDRATTAVMPDGYPQTSVVWCDFDGECVRVNTMREFQKERNMRRDPGVTLLCHDPRQPLRETRVICRIHARRIQLNAIHA